MPDDGPTSERLDSLRARWESELASDRPSGVFLQLADEYRRLGRTGDAIGVLEEGLGRNPNHPAALVALGRCRLELGQAAESTEVLERVIAADPTQMVAYRLLVEGYVERGRPEEARQRLRIYSLLNDADPEIAELRRRIGEIERQHREEPESPYLEDLEELEEPVEAAEATAGAPAQPAGETPAGDDPFPHLADPDSRRRYRDALAGGDLFQVEPDGGDEPPAAGFDRSVEGSDLPAEGSDLQAARSYPSAASADDLFGLGAGRDAPAPDLSSLLDGTRSGVAPEPPIEPEPAIAPEPEAPAPREATLEEDRAARRTVTLGRLYLRQGHREEAAVIFREVLEREPGNPEARAEIEALEAHEVEPAPEPSPEPGPEAEPWPEAEDGAAGDGAALTASDLLSDWEGGSAGAGPEGMTARKRHVLERYLERIRGRSGRDVH
jgi:tetratricopeptide (TPR) repeat protein